jgi:hypothetical protein
MIFTRFIDDEVWYHVCNDYGDCLIHTRSSQLAHYVHKSCQGIPRGLYLTIGGDPRTINERPMWQFRRIT